MNRSIFMVNKNNKQENKIKKMNLNFGPQHPAAHGVLRLVLQLNNEIVENNDIHIGLLHRGTEKLMETKMYIHSIPYFDRLDYCSMLIQEHAYCLAIEKILNKNSFKNSFAKIRTLFDELTRILNHLLATSCHALDVGSMTPLFWCFEEREKIMEFYERISGARMHAAFYRPNYLNESMVCRSLLEDIIFFVNTSGNTLNEMSNVLSHNKIWKLRLVNIGAYNLKTAIKYNLSGVMLRCVGFKYDLRLHSNYTYSYYSYIKFCSFIALNGDCYDRFLLRMYEIIESLNISGIVAKRILKKKVECSKKRFFLKNAVISKKRKSKIYMESMIRHFKYWQDGFILNKNFIYSAVESSKGEFGVFLVSNETNKPYRCKIKSPAYSHINLLNYLSKNVMLADLVTLIGTIDIVFGEVDR